MTHDPESMIHLLRDHLATHDKSLVFLFGAGTSSSINVAPAPAAGARPDFEPLIPGIAPMTERCREAVRRLSAKHDTAWTELETECAALGLADNIESILGRLRVKIDAAGPTGSALGLGHDEMRAFEAAIKETIAALASPDETRIPDAIPHDRFARWVRNARRSHPIEVFTTNYDILVERALERARAPFFDGFVGSFRPYFNPAAIEDVRLAPAQGWTRVWKLHGSTNWEMGDGEIVRTSKIRRSDMILPSHLKYDQSRKMPYLALMDRLAQSLSRDGTLLVTSGYSWGDDHVNSTILTALDANPTVTAIALMYEDLDVVPQLVGLAAQRENLLVLAPREGMLRTVRAPWVLGRADDRGTAAVVDKFFDSDALPGDEHGPVTGRMLLGDFNRLCEMLSDMSGDSPR